MKIALSILLCPVPVAALAADPIVVEMRAADAAGTGAVLGTVTVTATPYGTLFTPNLNGLTPGLHGFHVHEHPSCDPKDQAGKAVPALGAGGHFDPGKTGKHLGPYADGHLGDLPPLFAMPPVAAHLPVLAPRLKPEDVEGPQPDGARGRGQLLRSARAARGRRPRASGGESPAGSCHKYSACVAFPPNPPPRLRAGRGWRQVVMLLDRPCGG